MLLLNPLAPRVDKAVEQPERFYAPQTPLRASLNLIPLPIVGQPGQLICTVTSTLDAPGTRIEFELPPDAHLLSGNLTWTGDIPAGGSVVLPVVVSFEEGGDEAIYCRTFRRVDKNNAWSDYVGYYVNIGETESMVGFAPVPPEKRNVVGKQLWKGNGQITSTAPPPLRSASEDVPLPPANDAPLMPQRENIQPQTSLDKGACSTLTVTGWVGYADRSGNAKGADEMLVEVVNASTGAHLQFCYVNDDGTYSCPSVPNPYPTGIRTVARSWTILGPNSDILTVVDPNVGTTNAYQNAYTIWSGTSVFNTPAGCTGDMGGWWIDATGANRLRPAVPSHPRRRSAHPLCSGTAVLIALTVPHITRMAAPFA
jgi:hypothetical protein